MTLLLCHSCCPEFADPSDKFFLCLRLCVFANVSFQFLPQQFDRVQVRTFRQCFPPVYIVVSVKLLLVPWSMLGIIVLLESVCREHVSDERKEQYFQYLEVKYSIHNDFKNFQLCWPVLAYSTSDMDLKGMFWFWSWFVHLSLLVESDHYCSFGFNGGLISEYNIAEFIIHFYDLPAKFQTLDLVRVSDHLTIMCLRADLACCLQCPLNCADSNSNASKLIL